MCTSGDQKSSTRQTALNFASGRAWVSCFAAIGIWESGAKRRLLVVRRGGPHSLFVFVLRELAWRNYIVVHWLASAYLWPKPFVLAAGHGAATPQWAAAHSAAAAHGLAAAQWVAANLWPAIREVVVAAQWAATAHVVAAVAAVGVAAARGVPTAPGIGGRNPRVARHPWGARSLCVGCSVVSARGLAATCGVAAAHAVAATNCAPRGPHPMLAAAQWPQPMRCPEPTQTGRSPSGGL